MKKLLGLLAATCLVASSSISVVACGKKPVVSTDDSVLATKLLIDEFINEIGYRVYSHLESDSVRANLTRAIQPGVPVNDFFDKENIQKYGVNMNNLEGTVTPLGTKEKEQINQSFHNLVQTATIRTSINKLATDTDKYSILINNGTIVQDIAFDINAFTMSYVSAKQFLASASIRMAVNFNYLDYSQKVVSGVVSNTISLRITDDSLIQVGVNNLEKNLTEDLLNEDSGAVWNKATDRGYTQADLYKAFELYNDQNRSKKMADLIGSDKWQSTINNFISEKKYFENNLSSEIKLDVSTSLIKSDKLVSKIEPITYISNPDFYESNLSLRKTLFQKFEANDDLNFISGNAKGNKDINSILNLTFKESYSNFKNNMKSSLQNYHGTNLDSDSILLGEAVVAGLSLNFESLNFALPLNTLKLTYSFSLTGTNLDVETNNSLDKSILWEAIYRNTEAGIKSFQDNFGTSDSIEDKYLNNILSKFDVNGNLSDKWRKDSIRMPLVFSGTKKSNPLSVNIYDEIGDAIELNKDAGISKVNSTLSLETNNLAPVRYNLFNDGYQGNFSLKFASSRRIVKKNSVSRMEMPITVGLGSWRFANQEGVFETTSTGYSYKLLIENQFGQSLALKIDFSLLSVFVGMPEFYVHFANYDPNNIYKPYASSYLSLFAKI